jgi:hypothetical protein
MNKYHKIVTVYERDPATKHKTLVEGKFALPEFAYLAANAWVFTEKVDGTNIRVDWDGERAEFGGRTDNAQIHTSLYQRLSELFSGGRGKWDNLPPMTLYGEGYGAKIQKGGGNYNPDGAAFVLFDVFCGVWLERENVEKIAQQLGTEVVPIVGFGPLSAMVEIVRRGFNSAWGGFLAEGIVARPAIEMLNRKGERIITKLKHKDFR